MGEHRSAEVVRGFYEAFQHENYEPSVTALLHEGVVWQVAGTNPLAGTFVGVTAVLGAMRRYGEHSKGTLTVNTTSILADGEHVVAIHEATASRGDFEYHAHEIDVFHVADGHIVAMWSFSEDQAATDTLWS